MTSLRCRLNCHVQVWWQSREKERKYKAKMNANSNRSNLANSCEQAYYAHFTKKKKEKEKQKK